MPTRSRTIPHALGLAAACLAAAATPAAAQTGGTSPDAPAARHALTPSPVKASYGRPAPRIDSVRCERGCGVAAAARPGALVRVVGRGLRRTDEIVFLGADADGADDASVAPVQARRRSVLARVPRTALSGRVTVVRRDGTRAAATASPLAVDAAVTTVPPGEIDAEAQEHEVFFDDQRPAELSYVLGGAQPAEVVVQLVRAADGAAVAQWTPGVVPAGVPQTVRWDGMEGGRVARDGVLQFRVSAVDAAGTRATSAQAAPVAADAPGAFEFHRFRFPIAGAHRYGTGAAAFGGGRGHQGQDTFAACGTPLVAARGGVVKVNDVQSAAGNYLVVDAARSGVDQAYMHLRDPALPAEGERVRTGQLIGYVGDTGRADGCHLHFEEWTAPGWYSGGNAFDPLLDLKRWDAAS
jgi:murein DD-endopeptidase MepM/ murein hydrolase activator NlpD